MLLYIKNVKERFLVRREKAAGNVCGIGDLSAAEKGRWAMKSVTLKDVAKAAGVSYATVSRALSGSSQIGSDTRERIIKLCDEMGYTTNYVARSMVMKKTDLIGLVAVGGIYFLLRMSTKKSTAAAQ